jgi:hypothetical protein
MFSILILKSFVLQELFPLKVGKVVDFFMPSSIKITHFFLHNFLKISMLQQLIQISINYKKITSIFKFVVLSIALAGPGTSFTIVMEMTPIKMYKFGIRSGIFKRYICIQCRVSILLLLIKLT